MPIKYFDDQFNDEEVLFVFRKHPIVMRKGLIISMVAVLAGLIPSAVKPSLGFGWFFGGLGAGILIGCILLLPYWVTWFYSVFIVTDKRLIQITQKGFFHRAVVDMALNQIQMINYQIAGLEETLLGFGTIVMQTYVGDLVIHTVHKPAKIQKRLLEILRERGIAATPFPGIDNNGLSNNEAEQENEA